MTKRTQTFAAILLQDVETEEDGETVVLREGQRVDLSKKDFDAMAKAEICEEAVLARFEVSMVHAKGGDVAPGQTKYIRRTHFDAWKAKGIVTAAPEGAEALAERDAAVDALNTMSSRLLDIESDLAGLQGEFETLVTQARRVVEACADLFDGPDSLAKDQLMRLADLVPVQVPVGGGLSEEDGDQAA